MDGYLGRCAARKQFDGAAALILADPVLDGVVPVVMGLNASGWHGPEFPSRAPAIEDRLKPVI